MRRKDSGMTRPTAWVLIATSIVALAACGRGAPPAERTGLKIGVLLVAHGSKSSTWNGMVKTLADEVREPLLKIPDVSSVQLAYLEESKPNIASEMKALDAEGVDEIVVVPLFASSESTKMNNYLQYLVGVRSEARRIKQLQQEGYEVYYPRARVTVTPAMNESEVLRKNVLRRVLALKGQDSGENMGVVLVGYGDQAYGQQMEAIMSGIGRYLKVKTDIDNVGYAFCGKPADYQGTPVVEAINEMFKLDKEVIVVPVLLAVDEMLQMNAIQGAVSAIMTASKVRFKPDAILPDKIVNDWVIERVQEASQRIHEAGTKTVPAKT